MAAARTSFASIIESGPGASTPVLMNPGLRPVPPMPSCHQCKIAQSLRIVFNGHHLFQHQFDMAPLALLKTCANDISTPLQIVPGPYHRRIRPPGQDVVHTDLIGARFHVRGRPDADPSQIRDFSENFDFPIQCFTASVRNQTEPVHDGQLIIQQELFVQFCTRSLEFLRVREEPQLLQLGAVRVRCGIR